VSFTYLLVCVVGVSSSVLTSRSRQLHEAVAELLMWSDRMLLDGDTASVTDTQQASHVISAVKRAVNVRRCIKHKFHQVELLRYQVTDQVADKNLPETCSATSRQRKKSCETGRR